MSAELPGNLPDEVEQLRIHTDLFFLAPIAHEPIELLQRLLVILAVALVGNGDVFVGMNVVQCQSSRIAISDRSLQALDCPASASLRPAPHIGRHAPKGP